MNAIFEFKNYLGWTNEITAFYYALENEDFDTATIILQPSDLDINELISLHFTIEIGNSEIKNHFLLSL